MGRLDTFFGEYICPKCGRKIEFEEDTKDLNGLYERYYLGDYVDKGNRNYYWDFESQCSNCGTVNKLSIAIRRGQYVGVYLKAEAELLPVQCLRNIEDGYYRKYHDDKKNEEIKEKEANHEKQDVKLFDEIYDEDAYILGVILELETDFYTVMWANCVTARINRDRISEFKFTGRNLANIRLKDLEGYLDR